MAPMYSKRIFCYHLPRSDDEYNEYISHLLLTALRSTVEELPFLAGSVAPFSKDQPWLYDLHAHGAACLEVKDLSTFWIYAKLAFHHHSWTLNRSALFPAPVYIQDGPLDVCRLRANFVDGDLLLVLSIIHTVCDGRGITEVIKIFADKLRKAQTASLFIRPHLCAFGNGIPGAIENHPGWTALPLPFLGGSAGIKTSCTNFHITCDALRALKEVTSSSSSGSRASATVNALHPLDGKYTSSSQQATSISTNDAIAALIWRSIMLARYRAGTISERTITHFSQAVDCRSRLHLPEPYFGNAIYGVKASLTLHRLALATDNLDASQFSGLQAAGRAIRAEVNGATADKFRDLLGFVDRTDMQLLTRPSVQGDLLIGSILFVSYFYFEMHEIDFGKAFGGKTESFQLPSQGLIPGMPVVLPRQPDGSCEFVINEQEDVVNFLPEDETFQKFSSKCC